MQSLQAENFINPCVNAHSSGHFPEQMASENIQFPNIERGVKNCSLTLHVKVPGPTCPITLN